ncbi:hypothetical protein AAC03nite_21130 [Alicyclobacillus acidoterrestris]|nr:hypothetical protein AAC03nite_21130 [Alicyclobacillus acidoterrestris]
MTQGVHPRLTKGSKVLGKWTRQQWVVQGALGVGANGAVYAVRGADHQRYAMKVCEDAGAVAFEWGLLEQLSAHGFAFPKPHCIDDSAAHPSLYFYVMELVDGQPLDVVWPRLDAAGVKRILLATAYALRHLHKSSHAFCDIKPQNLLVNLQENQCVRFVDVGGVTPFGRSVRQFTPTSDVAFWGLGERRASARYDIAALALMVATLCETPPKTLSQWPLERRQAWMLRTIRGLRQKRLSTLLEDAVYGRINHADELIHRVYDLPADRRPVVAKAHRQAAATGAVASGSTALGQQKRKPQPRRPGKSTAGRADWTERLMWYALTCAMISTAGAWAEYLR